MTEIDLNSVNPNLLKHSLIEYKNNVVEVINVDKNFIYIKDIDQEVKSILDREWQAIILTEKWVQAVGLNNNPTIKNIRTGQFWTIRKIGEWFYLTIDSDPSLGENPIVPIHTVHALQYWFYLLSGQYLKTS